jgi:plastocyanin
MRVWGALLASAVVACSGAPAATGAATRGPAASSVTITSSFAFDPPSVTVAKGGIVTWTNAGGTTHTVTSGAPDKPTNIFNHAIENGKTFSVTFNDAGTFDYFCSIHQTMHGTVIVR